MNYNFNCSTILKFLRKVLNEINRGYVDSGLRAGFIMKRYIEMYKIDEIEFPEPKKNNLEKNDDLEIKKIPRNEAIGQKLVLLSLLKDIGIYYHDGEVPNDNAKLAACSSYAFLSKCSPLGEAARPLLFYKSKYIPEEAKETRYDYLFGLLMTLINQVVMYNYQEYNLEEIQELIKKDKDRYDPEQVKNLFKLFKKQPDIFEKLNDKTSLFVHETCNYIATAQFKDEYLLGFIDLATFSFEFHNHETLAHTVTVAAISEELGKLSRLPQNMIDEIKLASLVHDIGKIRVPIEILCFNGKLSADQFKEMKRHVVYTRDIIDGCFSYKIVDIASHHHEKLDGSGYPEGLRAIDLSIGDKIIAIADICSALYCKRSYKAAFSPDKIMDIINSDCNKGQLERRIVNHLIDNFDEIMEVTQEVERKVLQCYGEMKELYKAYSELTDLDQFFDEKSSKRDEIYQSDEDVSNNHSKRELDELPERKAREERMKKPLERKEIVIQRPKVSLENILDDNRAFEEKEVETKVLEESNQDTTYYYESDYSQSESNEDNSSSNEAIDENLEDLSQEELSDEIDNEEVIEESNESSEEIENQEELELDEQENEDDSDEDSEEDDNFEDDEDSEDDDSDDEEPKEEDEDLEEDDYDDESDEESEEELEESIVEEEKESNDEELDFKIDFDAIDSHFGDN